jgi:hypothetical protein
MTSHGHVLGPKLADTGEPLVLVAEITTGGVTDGSGRLFTLDQSKSALMALIEAVNYLRAVGNNWPEIKVQLVLTSNDAFEDGTAEGAMEAVRTYLTNALNILRLPGESFNIDQIKFIQNQDVDMCVVLSRTKNK